MFQENPTHLFISYAIEDSVLADWLARKLVGQGYAVWLDRLKLLGGEPWPQDIDVAIKERTFRMIGLLSKNSLKKPNPSKERTLALNIARTRGIPDFLIPLKVDSTELDWLTTDLTYLPFNHGWAAGCRQLLKKLDALNAPKLLVNRRDLAAASFDAGIGLVTEKPEEIVSNALLIKTIPGSLTAFILKDSVAPEQRKLLNDRWAFYQIDDRKVVAFGPPPAFCGDIWEIRESFTWADTEQYEDIFTSNIVRHLIERTLRARLLSAGCHIHPKRGRTFYLRPRFSGDGKLRFTGRMNKGTWCKIEGRTKVLRPGKPAEQIRHLFAFDLFRWHLSGQNVAIQIRPSLVFTDATGDLITDKKVGSLRRKLTKSWWNDKWLNRLLAAAEIVTHAPPIPGDDLELCTRLLRLDAEKSLNEAALGEESTEDNAGDLPEVHILEDDELEDENESA